MNIWVKIMVFLPLWLFITGIFQGIVFKIFPESLSGTKIEFDALMSTNYLFLFLSQIATLLGTFSCIYFISRFVDKGNPLFLKSMLSIDGVIVGTILGSIQIFLIVIILSFFMAIEIQFQGFKTELLWYMCIFFLVAVSEEAMSRGYIFSNLYSNTNKYLAIVISSMIFSILHLFNASFSITGMINITLIGIFLSLLYLRKMNLSIPIGFHFSWNLFQGPVFGFSVSGLETESIFKIENASGEMFTFNGFGLEGSLISTIVLTSFILYFYFVYTRNMISKQKQKESHTISVASV